MGRLLVALLLCLAGPGGLAAAPSFSDVNRRTVREVALPAYRELAHRAADLAGALADLCAAPADASTTAAISAYRAALVAWQAAQTVRLGPAFEGGRAAQVQFWPDRRRPSTRTR